MLFDTVIEIDTSIRMIHNISTSTLCFLLLLHLFIINSTLSISANTNAHHSVITPSTAITIEISMVDAIISSIIISTGINRCRTVVSTITITVVVIVTTITMIAIDTIIIIVTSTRLLSLLLLTTL